MTEHTSWTGPTVPHTDEYGTWEPMTPHEVAAELAHAPVPWCVAGGYAPEFAAGRSWRAHSDVDIVILRTDVETLRDHLTNWTLVLADSGTLQPWPIDAPFPAHVHDIWCQQGDGPWRFQLMVVDVDQGEWIFRRDHRVRGPLPTLTIKVDGLPVLAPEIQLLYKSRHPNRPKDEQDFRESHAALTADQSARLAGWLRLLYGTHPWLDLLESPQGAAAR